MSSPPILASTLTYCTVCECRWSRSSADTDGVPFTFVRTALQISDPELSRQASFLEGVGGTRPPTWLSVTAAGRSAHPRTRTDRCERHHIERRPTIIACDMSLAWLSRQAWNALGTATGRRLDRGWRQRLRSLRRRHWSGERRARSQASPCVASRGWPPRSEPKT